MLTYLPIAALLAALSLPNQAKFTNDHATVTVQVKAQRYAYQITNLGNDPIVGFQIPQHAAYNFDVPEGWQHDAAKGIFRGWTDTPSAAVAPDITIQLSMRVSSKGAVLATGPVTLRFASGGTTTVPGIWIPAREPRSYAWLVAGTALAVMILHVTVLRIKGLRKRDRT